jgi:hypothetical protein
MEQKKKLCFFATFHHCSVTDKPLSDRSIIAFHNIKTDNPIPEFLLAQADGNESIVGSILPLGF